MKSPMLSRKELREVVGELARSAGIPASAIDLVEREPGVFDGYFRGATRTGDYDDVHSWLEEQIKS